MTFDGIPVDTILARGQYATVRAAHEDAKKQMQILCGGVGATAAQVLRAVQPDNDAAPDMALVANLVESCRAALDRIDACALLISELSGQRAELRPIAWPKDSK